MTNEAMNKRVCEALGIQPKPNYDPYPDVGFGVEWVYPDFHTDPLALLRVMRQRNDFYQFVQWCRSYSEDGVSYDVVYDIADFIQKFLDTPGVLLNAVDEWIRRGK